MYNDGTQQEIIQIFGTNVTYQAAAFMSDTLRCDLFNNFAWPPGTTTTLFNQLEANLAYIYSQNFTPEGASLASSQFFQAIISQFDGTIKGTGTVKLGLYSAHDVTLMGFLIFMGLWD